MFDVVSVLDISQSVDFYLQIGSNALEPFDDFDTTPIVKNVST